MNEIDILKRRIEREQLARKQAEEILELKALELYEANEKLQRVNADLEREVEKQTRAYVEKEKQYKNLVDSAIDIIYSIDFTGKFLYVNSIGLKTIGLKEKDIIGTYFTDYIRNDYREKAEEFYQDVIKREVRDSYFEFPINLPDGTIMWLGQNAKPMVSDDGTPYFSVIARDITAKKQYEEELNAVKRELEVSEYKYRSIIENMELGLLEVDINGVVTRAYPLFCEMVGYTEEELLGKNAEDVLVVDEFKEILNQQHLDREEGKAGVYEIKIKKKSGEQIWVMISGAPFFDMNDQYIGSIGIHYDITPIKRLQEELIKAREIAETAQLAQKQFLATMSHEIRTPLNAIIGMSHLMQDTMLNEEQAEYLQIIISSTSILKALISDILDLSKIDSGNIEVQEKPIDIKQIFFDLAKVFKIKIGNKPISFIKEVDPDLDFMVIGDDLLLHQVMMNLLSNALKFTHSGRIEMRVDIVGYVKDKVTIRFAVKDTGIGISEEHQEIIFDQFKQASRRIQEEYGGTGLGLAITKKLVNLMGGEIFINSKLGGGAKFYFDLEFTITNTPVNDIQDEIKTFGRRFSFKYPILVVEDNAMNQKYIAKLLQKWEIAFDIAVNGKEGYEMAEAKKYSIILMDLQMPIMDGFESCYRIRNSENPWLSEVPIAALSASTLLSKKEEVLRSGMNDFLAKPFTPDQLAELLHYYQDDDTDGASPTPNVKEEIEEENEFEFSDRLDRTYLNSLYGDDLEYAMDMFDTFMENIPEELMTLMKAVQAGENELIYKIAHKIKPTFMMVGLTGDHNTLEKLEKEAQQKSRNFTKYIALLDKVNQEGLPLIENELGRLRKEVIN